ncbi:hypothetical protein DV738_g4964, partial [Chaetothyriales sp. CBS 135597]
MSAPGKTKGGGILPVNAVATRKAVAQPKQGNRAPAPKLRLIIRRLPPGLTETEFWTAIGEEWQVGIGKVEWAAFKDGKVSKDPAKASRPARAYLKVKDQALLDPLAAKVKATVFQDAKNTSRDLCLLGPPSLEFAPYNRMPTGRVRHDGRQGTIDQDQEFIDFLQSLTEPITNPAANGGEVEGSQEKATITPLVQYLKEKKANKAKEAAEKKSAKQREAREAREAKEAKEKKASTIIVKGPSTGPAASTTEKARVSKATQDTVKAIHNSTNTASKATNETTSAKTTTAATATVAPPTTEGEPKTPTTTSPPAPPTGPRSSRPTSTNPTAAPAANTGNRPAKSPPNPSSGAKSAFLKHANPSQGVTEELLRKTFEGFGTVVRCEIDKKKGLGYIDFDSTESLRKAMHASPVKVGGGSVVVLENRNVKKMQNGQTASTPQAGKKHSGAGSGHQATGQQQNAGGAAGGANAPKAK